MNNKWKDILAYTIVTIVIFCIIGVITYAVYCIIGVITYAVYMGGMATFLTFIGVLGAIGIGILVIWAFNRVFNI